MIGGLSVSLKMHHMSLQIHAQNSKASPLPAVTREREYQFSTMSFEHLYNLQYDVSRIKLPSLVVEPCLFSLCTRFCILCIGIDYSLDVHLIKTRTRSPESMVVIMYTLCFFHTGGSKLNLTVQQRHFAHPHESIQ